ncbi:hypothetical protein AAFF27_01325 [Xylophilus sp. GW821-FHT01B05]
MSKIEAQSSLSAAAAVSPSQSISDSCCGLEIKLDKFLVLNPHESHRPPIALASAYTCSPQFNCIQSGASTAPGLVTTLLPSSVSAVMVIVGWYVVNKAQSNRERRKQIREYVSNLCDNLEELEALTIGYHTTTREEAKEQEIISKLGRFEKNCSALPRFIESQKYLKAVPPEKLKIDGQHLQVLRKAMTLNHFGDEHTGALSRQNEYIMNLELASSNMQETLERVRIDSLD